MPLATYKTTVRAPVALLWDMMKDKIERPDKYVPGVTAVEIVNRLGDRTVERVMHVSAARQDNRVHEIISYDDATMTVVFKLKDDPLYTGIVTNTVFEEDGRVELAYVLYWTPKDPRTLPPEIDLAEVIKAAVLHAKALAEARAQKG